MRIFQDYQGTRVRLTDERLDHILENHEDMENRIFAIREAVESPDAVIQSNSNSNALLYYRKYTDIQGNYIYVCVVVIMLEDDAFVASAYLRERIREGTVLWEIQE